MSWNGVEYDKFQKEYQYHSGLALLKKLEEVNNLNGKYVVDLGCGNGELSALISNYTNCTVKCIDTDASMLQIFQRKYSSDLINIEHTDIASWLDKHSSSSVDVIFSNAVIHWLGGHEQLTPILLNCYRILKQNGMIALRFSLQDNALDIKRYLHKKINDYKGVQVDDFFYSKLTFPKFLKQLESIGFKVLISKEESYYPFQKSAKDLAFMLNSQPIYNYISEDCYAEFERYITNAWDREKNKVKLKSHHGIIIALKDASIAS